MFITHHDVFSPPHTHTLPSPTYHRPYWIPSSGKRDVKCIVTRNICQVSVVHSRHDRLVRTSISRSNPCSSSTTIIHPPTHHRPYWIPSSEPRCQIHRHPQHLSGSCRPQPSRSARKNSHFPLQSLLVTHLPPLQPTSFPYRIMFDDIVEHQLCRPHNCRDSVTPVITIGSINHFVTSDPGYTSRTPSSTLRMTTSAPPYR